MEIAPKRKNHMNTVSKQCEMGKKSSNFYKIPIDFHVHDLARTHALNFSVVKFLEIACAKGRKYQAGGPLKEINVSHG